MADLEKIHRVGPASVLFRTSEMTDAVFPVVPTHAQQNSRLPLYADVGLAEYRVNDAVETGFAKEALQEAAERTA